MSEVALTYDVLVTVDGILPAGAEITLDGRAPGRVRGDQYTFTDAGTFEAGEEKEHEHALTVSAEGIDSSTQLWFDVSVRAAQID